MTIKDITDPNIRGLIDLGIADYTKKVRAELLKVIIPTNQPVEMVIGYTLESPTKIVYDTLDVKVDGSTFLMPFLRMSGQADAELPRIYQRFILVTK